MFNRRGVVIHPFELSREWIEDAKEQGLNVIGLHPPGGPNAPKTLAEMLELCKTREFAELVDMAHEAGIKIEYELHALSYLMPRELFNSHPDWFRMDRDGSRKADCNLCASSEEGLQYLESRTEELARTLPSETHRYYFWLDDVAGECSCSCPKCRNLTPSDQQMKCLNVMLRGIRKADPEGKLAYIAYMEAMDVPTHVKPDEGIFLEYAPIRRDLDKPLNDENSQHNKSETRSLPQLLDFFGKKDSQVLDYWLDNSLMSGWKYPSKEFHLNREVVKADAEMYAKLGFESVTCFGCFLGKEYRDRFGKPDLTGYGEALSGE